MQVAKVTKHLLSGCHRKPTQCMLICVISTKHRDSPLKKQLGTFATRVGLALLAVPALKRTLQLPLSLSP